MTNVSILVARILLAILFIVAGLGKLGDVQGFGAYMASGGIPAFLAWPVVLFEILAGVAILVGFQTRAAALGLGAFCLVSGLLYHYDPADQMQMNALMKNLGLTGGYLLLAIIGAGRLSIDAKLGRAEPLPA